MSSSPRNAKKCEEIKGEEIEKCEKIKETTLKSDQCERVEEDYHGPVSHISQNSYFRRGGNTPKVQIAYQTIPGKIPRKLQIERRRREYLKLDFEKLLEEKGIDSNLIIPRNPNSSDEHVITPCSPLSPYLPLEIFDNEEYDCRTPDDWLALGNVEGSPDQKPLPAKALLPTDDAVPFSKMSSEFYRVNRFALRLREKTEALLLYHLSVDCMPTWSGTPSLDTPSLQRMKKHALSTPGLRLKKLERCVGDLEKEIELDYQRVMNRMSFDMVVISHSEFSHITMPKKDPEHVPQKGCISVPQFAYEKIRAEFVFRSLLTQPEVICALSEIWSECNKVATMKLFNVTSVKPLRLEEFEVLQSQMHTQISLYLHESWRVTLTNSIRSNLGSIGQGAYNINESLWEMYKLSKLYRLMAVVRFSMQDSLRYLVQDSLVSLTHLLMDACQSVLTCPQDLVWGNDLISSPYKPKKNPLFLVDLVLDQTEVHYSTPVEKFATSVVNLFDKGILATYNVSELDKKLFIGDDPLLVSVTLWETKVTELREKIRNALIKAAIPLVAYAAEYEEHLELYNLDMETFLNGQASAEQTSQEVKKEVEQHLKEKERIERSLPSSIMIGPFNVRVEAVRQALCNKRKALANAMLQRLTLKLRKKIDDACEECNIMSRKLRENPDTIEELAEKRDWMKQIPGQLKSYKEIISKILSDYELTEELCYCLPDEDANKKWTAIGWPQKIISQIEATAVQHVEDEERFRKIQLVNQNSFEETLDSLQMLVAGFASHADINHAHEVANEVRRTNKQLKECQNLAQTYNTRERLFGAPVTNYDHLQKMVKDFQPFKDLWTTTSDWLHWHECWLNDPLSFIDPEQLERNVTDALKTMHKCIKQFKDIPDCQMVATAIRSRIEEFHPYIPLIQGLRNPGMKSRHWELLSERIQMKVKPKANLTFSRCLELGLQNHVDDIAHVAEVAGKEYTIEQALVKMEQEWAPILFDVLPYKDTGTYILKSPDEASQLLDDHIDVLEEWLTCQRSWLYLEPIFSSDDITQQLPVEGKRYQQMDQTWKRIMLSAFNNPKVIELCPDARLLDKLQQCNTLLEQVQKGLSEYLETKRSSFPRFYFLSDDELLEILSQTKDPTAVQPHLRKCFENIAKLKFQSDLKITHMYSGEGEEVELFLPVWPTGNVENWLKHVELSMKATLRDSIERSLKVYPEVCVLDLQFDGYDVFTTHLGDLVHLVRGGLSNMQRAVLSALIVIEVHAKDVAAKLVEQKVSSINDFEWISQLRYYWAKDDLYIRAVNAEFLYGYEYLGNSGRLVITPLTDRCYLTLTGALHLKFGGAPAGPAGTGKTETTKDLGKALAIQTVVFNCSDQLDFIAMGKFLKGLASSGAWACFDEFNRIDVEVLSVVAQQITTIQKAQQQRAERFEFEGSEIPLVPSCAVFITMNPGYAGRTELPDNLKALFRPVAMMVPDYAMIAEISLYSFGFSDAKVLSKKITATFKLSSEQLSAQDHYDFGMRAVKTVISAAGNLKRENLDMDEELICLRAIGDVNIPKFLQDDLKLFNGIVSDLFPNTKQQPINYGILEESLRSVCNKKHLKDVDGYISKCIQLYETTVVRHGLMLVGPSGSGKTKCYEILGDALTALKGQPSVSGGMYEQVHMFVLNPKSITMGQLYGEYDLLTHEWTDGILSSLIRGGASSMDTEKKWYMFDGPVDAVWIENMNTVLDDNKKLCLSSGEIIKLSDVMTMMFEVQDLAVASPATVSRCGMVYLEPSILGLVSFTECWLKQVPEALKPYTEQLSSLFTRFLEDSITFVRTSVKEVITSLDSNLACSLLKLMDCFFHPFDTKEDEKPRPQKKLDRLKELIEPWFFFSLVWSVGATGDAASCQRFSAWFKKKMAVEKIQLCFPEEGQVYDYRLDDAGISALEEDEQEEERKVEWVSWMKYTKKVDITPETNYSDIIVPTVDTVRMSFLMDMLLTNKKPVLCIGPTGTGKTLTMSDKLLNNMPAEFITHFLVFSARTSANQTQDYIDSKLDKSFSLIDSSLQTLMCVKIHQMVAKKCEQYLAELSRYNYVTPKSYLELLKIFSTLTGRTKQELCVDTVVAEETRKSVQEEEAKASEKACFAGAIAADAQRDLDEALPALDAALTSLKSLNKNDVTEVRGMQRPPPGVKLVIEAVCIMKGIKPKKVPGEKPGTKIDDYWEPGKGLLQDPGKFLDGLYKYDKENIPDNVITLVQPYIDNEEFQPASIAKVSRACTSICQWVRAMHIYHFVAKNVEPKRQALKGAQDDLAETQLILDDAKGKLAEVEGGIATLQAKYQDCLAKKDELDNKYQLCEARLVRADKLIGGLADEKVRWKETVQHLDYMVDNVAGDVLLSAGYIAYLGPFTGEYRAAMADEWLHSFKELEVPHTEAPNLISTLGDPVKIRSWQISGLPKDNLSVENGVIVQYSLRWALFIDPQGQANTWIKNKERENGLEVLKLSDQDFLRSLENTIRFGKPCLLENIGEELDPALEPVLLQQTYKHQGGTVLKLGDTIIPYHDDFKMYITTKLPNPHYSPEVSTKVTLINFTLSPSGLEDQLLGQVVAEERPDLEDAKNQLIISNAKMKQELKEIEDEILFRLSSTEGNPVDNEELIQVLGASKIKAGEIKAKVMVAEKTEKDIDATRLEYVPVAVRTQILFFCVSDLSNVDPMYQYSLEWFLRIFLSSIANSERADSVKARIININDFFTFSLYSNVCRSLFEKHKLMFAFLVCTRIMMNKNKIDMTSDLSLVFPDSSPSTPLIFVLSPGTDPAADLYKFADFMQFSKKLNAISLGQGQGPWAEILMRAAMERGQWVFFQNCHLAPSWMPSLERLVENIDPAKVHKDFRVWLTSLPSNKFPVSILQNGSKMTIEPPKGIKANLQKTYLRLTDDFITSSTKITNLRSLLLSLCLFHGIALERRKFGPLGFNIPYEFTDGDLNICISQLKMFLDEYQDVPYKVLKYTAGEINYGGRVTDDWDRRCLLSVLEDFYCPAVLLDDYLYSSSGVYRQIDTNLDIKGYLAYIRGLPINDTPEIFGLHDNANISFAQNETFALLGAVVRLQPRAVSAGGKTPDEIVEDIVGGIAEKIPQPFNVQEVMEKYPVLYEESMNTVLMQEVIRYNSLLSVISQSLGDIVKALKGLVVMSSELELMASSLFNNTAYPSLKPLASWVSDLLQRISFVQSWIYDGIPPVFWISGFFFPQGFLTGTLQNYARHNRASIDTIGLDFKVMVKSESQLREKPNAGCYIRGLFLEGARWDGTAGQLTDSRPKELHTKMAVIWLIPKPNRKFPTSGVYVCPIYKTLTRAGTLSTTGHSTNYVISVELPSDRSQGHWIKRGVALLCALDY
ncbi:hypothetical protein F2P81_013021 [Scophthalmus maximus]|uniref:Dynein heavy chain 1 axonemal n=1 Tax=Scophthalmus maximus TaxID=52904 RepID=A0A6A4SMH8_SCOMX|nr:hypothetical protein F2P81_013021 [Scophthalmus maximus]